MKRNQIVKSGKFLKYQPKGLDFSGKMIRIGISTRE
jgi:hypothetical protein